MQVISNEAEVDRSPAKIAVLAVFGILLALGFSYFFGQLIAQGGTLNGALALLFSSLFLVVYVLQPILIKSSAKIYYIVFFESLALVAMFYALPPVYLFASFAVNFIFLALGSNSELIEVRDRLRVRVFNITKPGLKSGLTALSAFVVIAYLGGIKTDGALLSRSAFEQLLAPAEPIISLVYPGISLSDQFDKAARTIVEQQLAETPEAKLLSPAQISAFVAQSVGALRGQLADFLGVTFSLRDTIFDILYSWMNASFGALSQSMQRLIWVAIGAIAFFTVWSTARILSLPMQFFAFLLFHALILMKVAERFSESRSREFVVLK